MKNNEIPEWTDENEWIIPEPQAIGHTTISHWMPLPDAPNTESKP